MFKRKARAGDRTVFKIQSKDKSQTDNPIGNMITIPVF